MIKKSATGNKTLLDMMEEFEFFEFHGISMSSSINCSKKFNIICVSFYTPLEETSCYIIRV
jgi:hypothetical protein